MKRFVIFFLLTALSVTLLSGCVSAGKTTETEGELLVYYLDENMSSPSALRGESCGFTEEECSARLLLNRLLEGPKDSTLTRILPENVKLFDVTVNDDGVAVVDFSEALESLTDIDLTLACYSVTCTLCQLPEIQSVKILVSERNLSGNLSRELTPEDLLTAVG